MLQSTEEAFLLLTQQCRARFLSFPKSYFDVADIYRRRWLEERGHRLENVDRTYLVLASGKQVLQKGHGFDSCFRQVYSLLRTCCCNWFNEEKRTSILRMSLAGTKDLGTFSRVLIEFSIGDVEYQNTSNGAFIRIRH